MISSSRKTDADALVIGGGLMGACAAYALARAGKRVIVTDALAPASGATRCAIGLACPGARASEMGDTLRGARLLGEMATALGVETRPTRVLHLSSRPEERDKLRARLPELAEAGLSPRWESSPSIVPDGFGGGLSVSGGFVFDLPALTRALLSQPGILVLADAQINKIEDYGAKIALGRDHTLTADFIVLATNAQSGLFAPYLAESTTIARGVIWTSHPLTSGWYSQMRSMPLIMDNGRMFVAEDAARRLQIGSWVWDADDMSDPADLIRRMLRSNAQDLLHETLDWSGGVTAATTDQLPLFGAMDPDGRVMYATALGAYGAAWAPILADRIVALTSP
jgi:glycine/D-amino acid oxidase-like deaminating enzyme